MRAPLLCTNRNAVPHLPLCVCVFCAVQVSETDSADTYEVCGRGQLHLTVLIENMRREGFELMVGPPTVIERTVDGVKCEPFEMVDVTVPNDFSSAVVDMLNKRKGEMVAMGPAEGSEGQTQLKFLVPTRGMIGIRSALLTATKGTLVLDTVFDSYRPAVGAISQREKGSLLAHEEGTANPFGITGAQVRVCTSSSPHTAARKCVLTTSPLPPPVWAGPWADVHRAPGGGLQGHDHRRAPGATLVAWMFPPPPPPSSLLTPFVDTFAPFVDVRSPPAPR